MSVLNRAVVGDAWPLSLAPSSTQAGSCLFTPSQSHSIKPELRVAKVFMQASTTVNVASRIKDSSAAVKLEQRRWQRKRVCLRVNATKSLRIRMAMAALRIQAL